ncbi:hypothetical protein CVV67_19630 [Arthrobacter stackebrandtii]|nr:hypothetical protein CVV67_19630 [Arthrobacter stackebrandtii]
MQAGTTHSDFVNYAYVDGHCIYPSN